jgi:PAB-dependent poly(A)-specific ribonuclease subunit 3
MSTAMPSSGQYNLYASDHNAITSSGTQFYPQHGAFPAGPLQPPNYHLYQPFDTYRQELQPWQRATYDFFMPAKMREELQRKMFATQQVMPSESFSATMPTPLVYANGVRLRAAPAGKVALAISSRHQQQEKHFVFRLPKLGVQGPE